ncbi:MAG: fibronectin [Candidatus Marinimicrobia bacterium]|jgi:hypothetical protein|nr:fibronectin [Candidatus Neomarinimicrobiota bacterium]MBT3692329.1 fibronectin [Candidatus Neomarinimicrobiota bacterium]MBT4145097.1 fibronectin [Candidatus Neomarinimicrobiota bacterium]MBT4178055.1 fibronectin [Candidatus Neomarinimicrobiota bacterium]MBT5069612.1 fibronectin [Candidatus Neomarinimicrobiota bacterium]
MMIKMLQISLLLLSVAFSQVAETETRYVKISSLQSHFSAYGSERAWNNSYYEGLRWPADYPYQDNSVIKRTWITTENFVNETNYNWGHYSLYFVLDYVGSSLFPMSLTQSTKFIIPTVYVDGQDIHAVNADKIDEINPNQIADRIITNVVNTSMGLTMTRKIYVFTQQYHDNYFIKEFTFTNTGNTDWDDEIELTAPLNGVRIGWGTRYSCGREGTFNIGDGQSWGKHSWVSVRGEDYAEHVDDIIDESNPIVDWLRCGFSWSGQSSNNTFNNIGAPDLRGNGRLTSPHHVGSVVLHVDKNSNDMTDDPEQPTFLGWHAGDTYPKVSNLDASDELNMSKVYDMLSGSPHLGLGGIDRLDESSYESDDSYLIHNTDPASIHNDGGGTNVMMTYGPFDLAHGESITIVEAEGINGLSRIMCETIGGRWKQAYDNPNDNGPFILPDGSETSDESIYKNAWVFTGKDSLLETFGRAKRNYDMDMQIPQPPLPPTLFDVKSGGDRIYLSWEASPSEGESDFAGYKIYRALGKPDTIYEEIYDGPNGVYAFEDMSPVRGFSYYYYLVAYNDGSNNTSGLTNPTGPLMSNRFYTKTTRPAYLKRKAGSYLNEIRIVPNPYHISATRLQYIGERNKIMFLNIPAQCEIKIFTERGDLIQTIKHSDGSGDEAWDSLSSTRQLISSGIYLAHIRVTEDIIDESSSNILISENDYIVKKFIVIR